MYVVKKAYVAVAETRRKTKRMRSLSYEKEKSEGRQGE
jgi:hypothetical protein